MKIAFIRKNYTPYGGAERYLSRLIEELCLQGHEIHLLAHKWENGNKEKRKIFFHKINTVSQLAFLEALTFAFGTYQFLREKKFDVIHSFDRTFCQDLYRAGDGCHREWLKQRKKIDPWFKRISHRINPHHQTILFLERFIFNSPRLKYVIANSRRGREEIIYHYGVAEEKIKVIYNGIDLEKFHPRQALIFRKPWREKWAVKPKDILFLFVGSGFERKGLIYLLQALAQWRKQMVKLLIVGKDRISKYHRLAKKLKIAEQVIFAGPQLEMEKIYAAGDFLILPTIYEPFSNACVEALASGLPVITTRINGAGEMIKEEENGLLINEPTNILELTNQLEKALNIWGRNDDRLRIRTNSSLVSIESNVQDLLKIYEEIAHTPKIR